MTLLSVAAPLTTTAYQAIHSFCFTTSPQTFSQLTWLTYPTAILFRDACDLHRRTHFLELLELFSMKHYILCSTLDAWIFIGAAFYLFNRECFTKSAVQPHRAEYIWETTCLIVKSYCNINNRHFNFCIVDSHFHFSNTGLNIVVE